MEEHRVSESGSSSLAQGWSLGSQMADDKKNLVASGFLYTLRECKFSLNYLWKVL